MSFSSSPSSAGNTDIAIDEGLAIEAVQFMVAAASRDAREGTAAFVEKRKAMFEHR